MEKGLIVTADDYGLTRAITDDILETVDAGAVTQVSVLANGEALGYAMAEYASRAERLALSAHLNLTEGQALSSPGTLRLLANEAGMFRYSVGGLLRRYIFASSFVRTLLRREIAAELGLQWRAIAEQAALHGLSLERADGHQHAHMLPFVFDVVVVLPGIKAVRITKEDFYIPALGALPNPYNLAGMTLLRVFASRNRKVARTKSIATEDTFLGLLYSGRMSLGAVEEGLKASASATSLEIAMHPGTAKPDELGIWKKSRADVSWHYSPWRAREKAVLMSQLFSERIRGWRTGILGASLFSRLLRFGVSGSIAAAIDLLALYLFTSVVGIWYIYASVLAFFIAFVASFLLQKFWTFGNRTVAKAHHQAFFYLLIQLTNLALGTALLYGLVAGLGLWYLFAQFLVLLVRAVVTYICANILFNERH